MDTLLSMKVFCRVVQAGSFIAAANQLHLSAAMTSRHVSHLERHLNARLLHRNTRNLSLTEAGKLYYDYCQQVLDQLEEVEATIGQVTKMPKGQLKITAPVPLAVGHMVAPLQRYMDLYPEVVLDLNVSDREESLAEEAFDLALRIEHEPNPSLIARPLCPIRYALVCSPGYIERYGEPKTPADLNQHHTIAYNYALGGDHWNFKGPQGEMSLTIEPVMRVNHGEMGRRAAIAGVGIAILPTFIVGDDLRAGRLVPLMLDYVKPDTTLYALYLSRQFLSAKVRTFIDFMVEWFQGPPEWDRDLEPILKRSFN